MMNCTMDFSELIGKEIAYIKYNSELLMGEPSLIIWTKCGTVLGFNLDENTCYDTFETDYVLTVMQPTAITDLLKRIYGSLKNYTSVR